MIYTWFKRFSGPTPPAQIMSANQASLRARDKYTARFTDEVEAVGELIAKEVDGGFHTVEVAHQVEPRMALEIAAYFRRLGYSVDVEPESFVISWPQTPEDAAK